MDGLTRLEPGQRRALRIGGIVCLVIGLPMMMGGPLVGLGVGAAGIEDGAQSVFAGFGTGVLVMVVGFLLVAAGGTMARFGFMKAVTEVTATETSGAVEHTSAAFARGVGRGLADSGHQLGGTVVKVKCHACGFLDSEDARFCSGCGQAM